MNFTRVQELAAEQGIIVTQTAAREYTVQYQPDGKPYRFKSATVIGLAERLGLVNEPNYINDAKWVAAFLRMGEEVTAIAGLRDNLVHLEGIEDVMCDRTLPDEFGRMQWLYRLATDAEFENLQKWTPEIKRTEVSNA